VVREAFVDHEGTKLGAYGYSHGGGSVWLLSAMIDTMEGHGGGANKEVPDTTRIGDARKVEVAADAAFATAWKHDSMLWTAYIDAVGINAASPEHRVPYFTNRHFNRWQNQVLHIDWPFIGAKMTQHPNGNGGWTAPAGFVLDENNTDVDNDLNPAGAFVYGEANWNHVWNPRLTHKGIDDDDQLIIQLTDRFLKTVAPVQ
jgi:hypothetical protein